MYTFYFFPPKRSNCILAPNVKLLFKSQTSRLISELDNGQMQMLHTFFKNEIRALTQEK